MPILQMYILGQDVGDLCLSRRGAREGLDLGPEGAWGHWKGSCGEGKMARTGQVVQRQPGPRGQEG